jgi:hypothetical protein
MLSLCRIYQNCSSSTSLHHTLESHAFGGFAAGMASQNEEIYMKKMLYLLITL